MKVWIGATLLLCLLAKAEAAPLYTTTDLGAGYQLRADGGGQVHGVAGANGAVYAFDKSPVSSINERTDTPSQHADSYHVYTMQSGLYKAGYEYDHGPSLPGNFHPTFENSTSGWFTFPGFVPNTSPNPSPVSDINRQGQVVGTGLLFNGFNGYNFYAAFSEVNLQPHGAANSFDDNLNDYIAPIPGVTLTSAVKVDDLGRIIATGSNGDNFLLTPVALGSVSPVPEPSTAMLLGLAGSILGLRALRRGRR